MTFLDYGCVKEFTAAAVEDARRIMFAALSSDAGALRAELVRQRFIDPHDDGDPGRLLEWIRIRYGPILRREPFTIDRAFAEYSVRATVDPSSEWAWLQRRFNMPADYILLMRINLGLISVLAGLHARQTWRAIAEEFWYDAPPSTPLGRRDATFRAARAA